MKYIVDTRKQDKNGVKVTVRVYEEGTTVEADCQCLGLPFRTHSTESCPNRAKAVRSIPVVSPTQGG